MLAPLPIDEILPRLIETLRSSPGVVLSAPPGAGKTTRVPLAAVQAPWFAGKKILMLEPRRLATIRAAQYIAMLLHEPVGRTVGYRIRGETCISSLTRIEVLTEGVLSRLLLDQPDLPGVGLVIFDEFHERSIHADLGLALTLDVQSQLRNDVHILVMSATLDGVAVARLLGAAPVIESEGKSYPVETRYRSFPYDGGVEPQIVQTVLRAVEHQEGDVLVFLPGQREIRRVENLLLESGLPSHVSVYTLFGEAPQERQLAALSPAPKGLRKVILSTSIAETSLTIDGVRVVVDSGLSRSPRFDPRRGMSGLVTLPVSRAVADQRRGRAGREAPGVCYRLWTEEQHAQLTQYPAPEIVVADLAPLALDLAAWGAPDGTGLRFLDPPPGAHLQQARNLLKDLGAFDAEGKLSDHGRAMAGVPVHPRLSHMIIRAMDVGLGALACDVAALLEERDLMRGAASSDTDLGNRLLALRTGENADSIIRERVMRESRRLRDLLGIGETRANEEALGLLVAFAYPERIARSRAERSGRYQTVGGTGAIVAEWSPLAREEFLAIAEVDGVGIEVRVLLAAPLRKTDLLDSFNRVIVEREEVAWSTKEEAVVARRIRLLGTLVISEQSTRPHGDVLRAALLEGIHDLGIGCLPWNKVSRAFQARSEWLRLHHLVPQPWPELSDSFLLKSLAEWLWPFVEGMTRREHLSRLNIQTILRSRFSADQIRTLDHLAPAVFTTPAGSRIALDYTSGDQPILAVRLQEMFGQTATPAIAHGEVNVVLHLLSPAGRPIAVTQDLPSFWRNTYQDVRTQMRARYPKHHWPEDPLSAKPTKRTKKR
jgi:ATP-dependent helicase HrpB